MASPPPRERSRRPRFWLRARTRSPHIGDSAQRTDRRRAGTQCRAAFNFPERWAEPRLYVGSTRVTIDIRRPERRFVCQLTFWYAQRAIAAGEATVRCLAAHGASVPPQPACPPPISVAVVDE